MKAQITLAQWKADKELELRSFELYWRKMMEENPADFPHELPAGDWEEQFSFFVEEV